jgi:hypothetical protein
VHCAVLAGPSWAPVLVAGAAVTASGETSGAHGAAAGHAMFPGAAIIHIGVSPFLSA